jgi:thiol-disulfide isomerase/thioredoxin
MKQPIVTRRWFALGCFASTLVLQTGPAFSRPIPKIALIFVGANWCPVCHAAAAVLAPAAERSSLEILVASHDGKPIAPWPDFVDARGHPLTAEVKALPTLLFVDLVEGTVIAKIEGFGTAGGYLSQVRATLKAAAEAGHG